MHSLHLLKSSNTFQSKLLYATKIDFDSATDPSTLTNTWTTKLDTLTYTMDRDFIARYGYQGSTRPHPPRRYSDSDLGGTSIQLRPRGRPDAYGPGQYFQRMPGPRTALLGLPGDFGSRWQRRPLNYQGPLQGQWYQGSWWDSFGK